MRIFRFRTGVLRLMGFGVVCFNGHLRHHHGRMNAYVCSIEVVDIDALAREIDSLGSQITANGGLKFVNIQDSIYTDQ